MFKVTAVSYRCSDSNTERDENAIYVIEAETSTAPQGDTSHPMYRWWMGNPEDRRTMAMTGTVVDGR